MVSATNITTITMLQQELNELNFALQILSNEGRITRMTCASKQDVDPGDEVTIKTSDMAFPSSVINSVIEQINTRIAANNQQLSALVLRVT